MDRLKRVWSSYKDLTKFRATSQTSDDSEAHPSLEASADESTKNIEKVLNKWMKFH